MPISRITGASIEDGSITLADLGITTIDSGTGNTLTLQANSRTGITIDVTGNTAIANTLTFSSTGARIRGDFSNATHNNRFAFQTSTANNNTTINAIPNGTGTVSQFIALSATDLDNSSRAGFNVSGSTALATFFSDITGTGTYLPMRFNTGGSERLRIDTSGNMMLGVTSASSSTKFDVYGTSAAAHVGARVTNAATDGYSTLWLSSSNDGLVRGGSTAAAFTSELAMLTSGSIPLTFYTANTKRMTIGASGNIGIGTTSPSQLLHVAAGTILSSNTAGTIATVSIAGNGSTVGTSDFALQQGTSSEAYVFNRANSYLVLGTNNTERMRITSAGLVSITTATVSGATTLLQLQTTNTEVSGDAWGIRFGSLNYNRAGVFGITENNGNGAGALAFYTNTNANAFTERMRIDSSGNVGIGTTTLTAGRLSVVNSSGNSGVNIDGQSATGTGAFLRLRKGGVDTGFLGQLSALIGTGTSSDLTLYTEAGINLLLYTGGAERMRITSGGDVGIGTSSPRGRLEVVATGISAYFNSTNTSNNTNIWLQSNGADTFGIEAQSSVGGNNTYLSNRVASGGIYFRTTTGAGALNAQAYISGDGTFYFNSGYGSLATAYGCRAWVNFNGTGVVAIRASGNVSSITDNGVGDYTINFTNAMPDVNYAISGLTNRNTIGNWGQYVCAPWNQAQTTTTCRIATIAYDGNFWDCVQVTFKVIR